MGGHGILMFMSSDQRSIFSSSTQLLTKFLQLINVTKPIHGILTLTTRFIRKQTQCISKNKAADHLYVLRLNIQVNNFSVMSG